MNKKLILPALLLFSMIVLPSFANGSGKTMPPPPPPAHDCSCDHMDMKQPSKEEMAKRRETFEKRLKLTDEQKAQAKIMREKSKAEIKPIYDAINAKKEELNASIKAKSSKEEVQEIQKTIFELSKKAHDKKMKNMREFEKLLDKKQLKELEKMKEEGRKKFEKEHKSCKCGKDCKCKKGLLPPMPPKE